MRSPSLTVLAMTLAVAGATGCTMATKSVKAAPLDAEGEVWVYLGELPQAAERLQFTFESVALTRADGQEFPLSIAAADVSGKEQRRQRLLASGRVAPGEYAGLSIRVKKATLDREGGSAVNLMVSPEPSRVAVPFTVARARARVVTAAFQFADSIDRSFGFRPAFLAAVPTLPIVELLGFVTDTDSDAITVFDKKTRQVAAVLATGRDPRGLLVDRFASRLHVALEGSDEVASYDLITGEEVGRARLQPGDRPRELGLAADGRTMAVTCSGSNSVAFVDASALVEVGRTRAGLQPTSLLVDRSGRRGYAFNQGSSNVTVVDLATRSIAASIPTDGAPARGAFNRAGDRLYVVAPTSAYMTVLAVPTHATVNRIFVGFNAVSVHVDPRNDWVYVSMGDTGELQLFAPATPLPVGRVELPGAATWLSIDESYDVLLGVVPSAKGVAAMELTSRKVLPLLDTGEAPYAAAVVGERR